MVVIVKIKLLLYLLLVSHSLFSLGRSEIEIIESIENKYDVQSILTMHHPTDFVFVGDDMIFYCTYSNGLPELFNYNITTQIHEKISLPHVMDRFVATTSTYLTLKVLNNKLYIRCREAIFGDNDEYYFFIYDIHSSRWQEIEHLRNIISYKYAVISENQILYKPLSVSELLIADISTGYINSLKLPDGFDFHNLEWHDTLVTNNEMWVLFYDMNKYTEKEHYVLFWNVQTGAVFTQKVMENFPKIYNLSMTKKNEIIYIVDNSKNNTAKLIKNNFEFGEMKVLLESNEESYKDWDFISAKKIKDNLFAFTVFIGRVPFGASGEVGNVTLFLLEYP